MILTLDLDLFSLVEEDRLPGEVVVLQQVMEGRLVIEGNDLRRGGDVRAHLRPLPLELPGTPWNPVEGCRIL